MKAIPRSVIEDYTKKLNAVSAKGQAAIAKALKSYNYTSIEDLRLFTIELMAQLGYGCADAAASLSADFYDDVREASVGKPLGAEAHVAFSAEAMEASVRYLLFKVIDDENTERFTKALQDKLDFTIKKASGDCVEYNVSRDPLKPKYARVPTGAETCEFCIMLASRGFVYNSANTAGAHYHANCDCRVVPGFDGINSKVEGYDPDEYEEMWRRNESKNQRVLYRSKAEEVDWHNPAVEKLNDTDAVKEYLKSQFDIEARDGFLELPIDAQKSVVAGIEAATSRYGSNDAKYIDTFKSRDDAGAYDPFASEILLDEKAGEYYIVAFHETIHAIDAEKSTSMPNFVETNGMAAYNLYSKKVVNEARATLHLSVSRIKYKDYVSEIAGYNPGLTKKILGNDGELVAYALDREERGKSNALSKAIREGF